VLYLWTLYYYIRHLSKYPALHLHSIDVFINKTSEKHNTYYNFMDLNLIYVVNDIRDHVTAKVAG